MATPDPVAYDDTVELGVSSETDEVMAGTAAVPRVQVFYSQLQYVVGYNGVESFADTIDDDRTERQFGYPLVAYVETFDDADPGTTDPEAGTTDPEANTAGSDPGTVGSEADTIGSGAALFSAPGPTSWTPADEARYVVDSEARTSAGAVAVPFADRNAATAFADEHGGEVVDWATVRARSFDVDTAATVRSMAPDRWTVADDRLAAAESDADRPVSVVVGDDEPTLSAAVDAAPPETTVVVPPGTYDGPIEVTDPITIVGTDAHVRGDGNGSVITVRAPDVAIAGLSLSGTGNLTRDADAVSDPPDADADGGEDADADGGEDADTDGGEDPAAWDTNVQLGYGHGDAGVRAIDAPGLFVDDVAIETDASGVLLREGSDAVIRNVRVDGPENWQDGFMGVIGMESTVTVTDSAFEGGRDGVYLHRADGSVVRNSTFTGNRYGAHLMYTGDALIADNTVRDAVYGGITVMTRPANNAIVGNDVRDSPAGIQASGTRTYVGYNTLADNGLGFSTSSRGSLYEHNVLAGNEEGARATTVVPSSRVVGNDFVGNDRHAGAGAGALRVWTDGDRGNYWEGADAGPHAPGDRAYRPTSPVDAALHHETAAVTMAESPAAALLDRLLGTVPGARSGSIIDTAPSPEPHVPERVASATDPNGPPVQGDWRTALADQERSTDDGGNSTTQ
ncbi:copper-binding protein [Halorubrum sp. JWXQ-INN 858]|nr:copper-binding protein [Halorubrum sp. JWXQ-INN 858]